MGRQGGVVREQQAASESENLRDPKIERRSVRDKRERNGRRRRGREGAEKGSERQREIRGKKG